MIMSAVDFHGYDASAGYTYGFCPEMAPDWLDLSAMLAGAAPARRDGEAPFRYLELGCGQGMGLCLLAAANPKASLSASTSCPTMSPMRAPSRRRRG